MRATALAAAALLASASLALACATSSGAVDGVGGEDVAGGRLYREHCGSCHRLRDPSEQTAERWSWALDRFGGRAHLSAEQRRLVLGYLTSRALDAGAAANEEKQ